VTSAHGLSGCDGDATACEKTFLGALFVAILFGMASVVYLTSRAPAKLTGELMLAGHRTWECLSVSEALYICEREWIDAVVIAPDVEDRDFIAMQLRHMTIQLKPEATANDLIWELSNLFPARTTSIQ
jgi:hypothetical protein